MRRLYRLWVRFRKRKGTVAIVAITIGNIASLLGKLQAVNQLFADYFKFKLLVFLYSNVLVTVSLIFLIGYAFAFYWFYQRFIKLQSGAKKIVTTFLAACVVVAVFAANIAWLPEKPSPELQLQKKISPWVEIVFRAQDTGGGIRGSALNPSIGTQVWTTAQCLVAVLSAPVDLQPHVQQVKGAFGYIEQARHPRPEHPDEEKGWGLFEERDKAVTEIAGWVVVAYVASLESPTKIWSDAEQPAILERIERDLSHIIERQAANGGFRPLSDEGPDFNRTYSTAMAVWALVEAKRSAALRQRLGNKYDDNVYKGVAWLLQRYDEKNGWVPNPDRQPQNEHYQGLTAHVLYILSRAEQDFPFLESHSIYLKAERDFVQRTDVVSRPLNQNNRIHDYDVSFRPTTFQLEPSTFLWFPWTLVELKHLSTDASLSKDEQKRARRLYRDLLSAQIDKLSGFVETEFMYVLAEHLFCISMSMRLGDAGDAPK